jgi:hypothetical protein
MFVLFATSCTSSTESEPIPCSDPPAVAVTPDGSALATGCPLYGTIGTPSESAAYRHLVHVPFGDALVLQFFFPNAAEPAELELGPREVEQGDIRAGAILVDYRGWEGGDRSLCVTEPGAPANAARAGSLRIDATTVGSDGVLTDLRGELEVELGGCTIESLGLADADIAITASF